MKLKEIFDKISQDEEHKFIEDEVYVPQTKFFIPNSKNIPAQVIGMVIKKDIIYKVVLDNEVFFEAGSKHKVINANKDTVFVKDLCEGCYIDTIRGLVLVKSIENTGIEDTVYDLSIDDPSQLFLDADGIIHHNTYTVTKKLAGSNTVTFKGSITSAAALYKILFQNNKKGLIIIFDDLDELLKDNNCVNILKGALDTSSTDQGSEVSYLSNNNVHPIYYKVLTGVYDRNDPKVQSVLQNLKINLDDMSEKNFNKIQQRALDPSNPNAILPNKFYFQSRVIFISNLYLQDIPGAIISRGGTKIEVNLTLEEIVNRIERLLPNLEIPTDNGETVPEQYKKMAIKFCKDKLIPYGKINKLDFRSFYDICRLASSGSPVWEKWAAQMILQSYGDKVKGLSKR